MKGTTTQIGRYGEDLAAAHLIRNGFTVVRRNFRVARNGSQNAIGKRNGKLSSVDYGR